VTAHPLAGPFSVEASARRIRHYRYAEERMMRALGGWIALTPELPAKLLFGRHVWDCAQHADAWGRRLPELRAPAQQSEPPNAGMVAFMDRLESRERPEETIERITGVYRVLKPHLIATYERHLAAANPVYEPPTLRILERCRSEERRHVAAGTTVLARLIRDEAGRRRAEAWERSLLEALAAAAGVAGDTPEPPRVAAVEPGDAGSDLVALDAAFEPGVIAPDLRRALDAYAAALVSADWARLQSLATPAAWDAVRAVCERVMPCTAAAPVAQAKVGGFRLVKLRLEGSPAEILRLQWRPRDGEWRVVEAEVVR
jgi:hypothetical protein